MSRKFAAEPAPTARSKCQYCDRTIPKKALRIGRPDTYKWYHPSCFSKAITNGPRSTSAISGFNQLSNTYQQRIRKSVFAETDSSSDQDDDSSSDKDDDSSSDEDDGSSSDEDDDSSSNEDDDSSSDEDDDSSSDEDDDYYIKKRKHTDNYYQAQPTKKKQKRDKYNGAIYYKPYRQKRACHGRKVLRLYHQTDKKSADAIKESLQMIRGSDGMYGGGIYFAETEQDTDLKAHNKGYMIVADVFVGRELEVLSFKAGKWDFSKLWNNGYDSIYAPKGSGTTGNGKPERVVFNYDQVRIIHVYKI